MSRFLYAEFGKNGVIKDTIEAVGATTFSRYLIFSQMYNLRQIVKVLEELLMNTNCTCIEGFNNNLLDEKEQDKVFAEKLSGLDGPFIVFDIERGGIQNDRTGSFPLFLFISDNTPDDSRKNEPDTKLCPDSGIIQHNKSSSVDTSVEFAVSTSPADSHGRRGIIITPGTFVRMNSDWVRNNLRISYHENKDSFSGRTEVILSRTALQNKKAEDDRKHTLQKATYSAGEVSGGDACIIKMASENEEYGIVRFDEKVSDEEAIARWLASLAEDAVKERLSLHMEPIANGTSKDDGHPRGRGCVGVLLSGGVDSSAIATLLHKAGARPLCFVMNASSGNDTGRKQNLDIDTAHDASINIKTLDKEKRVVQAVDELSTDLEYARLLAGRLGLRLVEVRPNEKEIEDALRKVLSILKIEYYMPSTTVYLPVIATLAAFHLIMLEAAKKEGIKHVFDGLGSEELFAGFVKSEKTIPDGSSSSASGIEHECRRRYDTLYLRDTYRAFAVSDYLDIEVYSPLYDLKIAEFALSLPGSLKIKNNIRKYIWRKAAEIIGVPKEICWRKNRAAQYSSGIDSVVKLLSDRYGFQTKLEYILHLIKERESQPETPCSTVSENIVQKEKGLSVFSRCAGSGMRDIQLINVFKDISDEKNRRNIVGTLFFVVKSILNEYHLLRFKKKCRHELFTLFEEIETSERIKHSEILSYGNENSCFSKETSVCPVCPYLPHKMRTPGGIFIAKLQGKVIGGAVWKALPVSHALPELKDITTGEDRNCAEIVFVGVYKKHRGAGVGGILLSKVMEDAGQSGY
ncbi:MAG: GNAT family N-acetyltransferase, partial [Thermoplasmata archaeon]